jgi:hypothetical protein
VSVNSQNGMGRRRACCRDARPQSLATDRPIDRAQSIEPARAKVNSPRRKPWVWSLDGKSGAGFSRRLLLGRTPSESGDVQTNRSSPARAKVISPRRKPWGLEPDRTPEPASAGATPQSRTMWCRRLKPALTLNNDLTQGSRPGLTSVPPVPGSVPLIRTARMSGTRPNQD